MRLWVSLLQVSLSNPFPGKKAFPKLVAAHKKLWRVGFTFTSGRTSDFSYYQQEKRCPCQNHSSWEQQMRFHWQDHSSENMLCWSLRYRLGTDDIVDWEETYACILAGSKEPCSSTAVIESSLLPPRYFPRLSSKITRTKPCHAKLLCLLHFNTTVTWWIFQSSSNRKQVVSINTLYILVVFSNCSCPYPNRNCTLTDWLSS